MRAIVALRRRRRLRIDVERIVGTGLHARLAADAAAAVEVDDPVVPTVERDGRANGDAGRRVAVVAPEHGEIAAGGRGGAAPGGRSPMARSGGRGPGFLLLR